MAPPAAAKATPTRPATSRLLAMKFMSRLGDAQSSPTTPSPRGSAPSTPVPKRGRASYGSSNRTPAEEEEGEDDDDDDDEGDDDDNAEDGADADRPSAKRRRVQSRGSDTAGASIADMEATMRASMADEERRRQAAIKKRAAELGDEHWTWDAPLPPHVAAQLAAHKGRGGAGGGAGPGTLPFASVVRVGFAEIDERTGADAARASLDSTGSAASSPRGPRSSTKPRIMRFNMAKGQASNGTDDDEADDAAPDEGGPRSDGKGARKRARSDAEPPKKKDMPKLKHLTSLSSQGGQSAMKCHQCGRAGHKAASCPKKKHGAKKR